MPRFLHCRNSFLSPFTRYDKDLSFARFPIVRTTRYTWVLMGAFWEKYLHAFDVLEECRTTCLILISCVAYCLTVKMEAVFSSKMSVDFYWAIWHYILEDRPPFNVFCQHWVLARSPSVINKIIYDLSQSFQVYWCLEIGCIIYSISVFCI
jgi:hypothetical protein